MLEIMQAHWLTVLIIVFSFAVPPLYWFIILERRKAIPLALATAAVGALMAYLTLIRFVDSAPYASIFILFMWAAPSILVLIFKKHFQNIEQKPLVALQIFRVIGGVFIIEMFMGNIPGSFAWPAGIGDIIVGILALFLVLRYRTIPQWGVFAVIILGVADFISAFFFGFFSQPSPVQLFAFGFDNLANAFPTGLIPIYLVPTAIMYHTISWLNRKQLRL